jgi:protein TonB
MMRFFGVSAALHAAVGALAIAFVSIGEGDGATVQPTVEVTLVAWADEAPEAAAAVSLAAATPSLANEPVPETPVAAPFTPIDAPAPVERTADDVATESFSIDDWAGAQPRFDDASAGGGGGLAFGAESGDAALSSNPAGGRPGSGGDDTSVWAWLEKQKRYPRAALQRRLEGEVTLDLVLDGTGRVRDARIVRSSGHRSLDDEVTRMVARADPFPITGADSREYRIVIEFHLEDR